MPDPRVAIVLGGGAARALAHVGVFDVLEREGVTPAFAAGSSMGGLLGALWAAGLDAGAIRGVARGFRFPSWFVPGGILPFDRVFPTVGPVLEGRTFADLPRGLAVVATHVESGRRVVMRDGPVLTAVRATCSVPGVLPPVRVGDAWLVDGGLVSLLPVDVAGLGDADVVVAIAVHASGDRSIPMLRSPLASATWAAGSMFPNPATARLAFELLVRSAEIALDRQVALASAMVTPDVLVDVDVGTIGLRDFARLDEAAAAGSRAMTAALPALREALARPARSRTTLASGFALDPICDMVVDAASAPSAIDGTGVRWHFCSVGCRDAFLRARAGAAPDDGAGSGQVTP